MYYVSQNIRYLRVKRDLSQNQLAIHLRLTRNQINSYENGNSQPSIEILQRIAEFFEISMDTMVKVAINKDTLQDNKVLKQD